MAIPTGFIWGVAASLILLLLGIVGYLVKNWMQGTDESTVTAQQERARIANEAKKGREKLWQQVSEVDAESIKRDTATRQSVTELRDHVNGHFVRHRELEDIKTTLAKIEKKQDENYQRILSHLMGRD